MTAPSPYAPPQHTSSAALPDIEPWRGLRKGIAVATYAVFFGVTFLIVRDALGWVCTEDGWCLRSSAPWKFWFTMPVLPTFLIWLGARRVLDGPAVERHDLMLFFSVPPDVARDGGPRLGGQLQGLGALGYAPRAFVLDERLQPTSEATGLEPLLGPRFLLLEKRSRARCAFLRLMLSAGNKGTGIIEVSDTAGGLYGELGSYILRALAQALPELRFRRYDSSLPPEPAGTLALPAQPTRLA